jgi:hypothetical protein
MTVDVQGGRRRRVSKRRGNRPDVGTDLQRHCGGSAQHIAF